MKMVSVIFLRELKGRLWLNNLKIVSLKLYWCINLFKRECVFILVWLRFFLSFVGVGIFVDSGI